MCSGEGRPATTNRCRVLRTTWQGGRQGTEVVFLKIEGGGHTWPGADAFNVGLPIGKTTRDVDANELIWQFFSRHRR